MVFAAAYAIIIVLQWYLLRRQMHRALHRFNYFLILADHALFTSLLVFYYNTYSPGNFNHALKSPYVVLLLLPTLTTLIQFRHKLLLFSLATCLTIVLAFYGYARLSGVPQSTNWLQYILGDSGHYARVVGIVALITAGDHLPCRLRNAAQHSNGNRNRPQ